MDLCKLIFLWSFAAAAFYLDLRYRRIPNTLIAGAAASGVALNACGGWSSLRGGLGGFLLGAVLLLPAFILHMVGGGDVKTLAVTGLYTGTRLLWICFLIGASTGGVLALLLLAIRFRRKRRRSKEEWAGEQAGDDKTWSLPYAGILALSAAVCFVFWI